jgi:hypothetical protein
MLLAEVLDIPGFGRSTNVRMVLVGCGGAMLAGRSTDVRMLLGAAFVGRLGFLRPRAGVVVIGRPS